jgi:hypothetical protein
MKPDSTPFRARKVLAVLVTPLLALMFTQAAVAAPGEAGGSTAAQSAAITANSLNQFKVIVGRVVLSEDACGTNTPAPRSECTVQIVKPSAAATVRQADLFCATTGFSGYMPQDGDVTVNGAPVTWDEIIPNAIQSFNARDDVTATVKPVGDAAPPGLVVFTISESPTFSYDGCILKVIWDDPTTTQNSILIFWGAQETTGDTFVITFAQPLGPAAFLTPLEFSLGISFGAQGCSFGQFSQVDVNNLRLTTSAGGEDDGVCQNGALITVGGTGDNTLNPPPLAPPTNQPSVPDDELYDLRPFVRPGDTSMTIFTLNPSNDDNIFIANLFLRNVTVVGPEPPCPPDNDDNGDDDNGRDDDDNDGLTNKNESLLLTLLADSDSDDDGIVDGNDDANGDGEDDEDEDDDECPDDDDSDDDGVDDEDEDDDEDDD